MSFPRRRRRPSAEEPGAGQPGIEEQEILAALGRLRDTTAREVMTPRVDVIALKAPVTVGDVGRAVRESGHSRFPVYQENLDHLVGILFVKDLFRTLWPDTQGPTVWPHTQGPPGSETVLVPAEAEGEPPPLVNEAPVRRLRRPFLVPEGRHVLDVLAAMRQGRNAFAVVVDEYGGVDGVLTIKDLVSELVGELPDEFDQAQEADVLRVDPGRWLVAGDTPVDDVTEQVAGLELPEGEYVTLGGFLFERFGHIPTEGETLDYEGWELRVLEMDRRRIAKVVIKTPSGSIEAAGQQDQPDNGK